MKIRIALALVLLTSGTALAQEATQRGPGVKVGAGTVFHPSVGAEAGFISNMFYENTDENGTGLLRVVAGLTLSNIGSDRDDDTVGGNPGASESLEFEGGVGLRYNEYLSSNDAVTEHRNLSANVDFKMATTPDGPISFFLNEKFKRDTRPPNYETGDQLERDVNNAQIGVKFRPGGRAIDFGVRYESMIDYFEDDRLSAGRRLGHTFGAHANWQFLPVSRVFVDVAAGFQGAIESDSLKQDSVPVRVRLGAGSALTELTSVDLSVGYGATNYDAGPDFSGVIARAEFGYRYNPRGRFSLGYGHDFNDSINANYYRDHMINARVEHEVDRVMLSASVATYFRTYAGVPADGSGDTSRDDFILDAALRASYLVTEAIAFTAKYQAIATNTDYRLGGGTYDPSFVRHEIIGGVRASF